MKQWYALFTKPNSERRVAVSLRLNDIETYLPEINVSKNGDKPESKPFFPSYLFIRIDLDVQNPNDWRWVPGVRKLVSYGQRPVPVPDEVIHLIRVNIAEKETRGARPAHNLKPGDVVRIQHSSFKDMLAIFEGPMTPSERVYVLLTAMNNSVRLRVPASELEKVPGAANAVTGKRRRRSRGRGRPIN
jgi:transcriptional antiterminator RfaH